MVQIEKLEDLKFFIENLDSERFGWNSIAGGEFLSKNFKSCGCVAGWSQFLLKDNDSTMFSEHMVENYGISICEAEFICYGSELDNFPNLESMGPLPAGKEEPLIRLQYVIDRNKNPSS